MKVEIYLIVLVGLLVSCSTPLPLSRGPAALSSEATCLEGADELLKNSRTLSEQKISELLITDSAQELEARSEVKEYLEFVSDPKERKETLAYMVLLQQKEGNLSLREMLIGLEDSYSRCH